MTSQVNEISFLIKRVSDNLNKFTNTQKRDAKLSFSQIRVITYLKENQSEKKAQKDIERFLGVSHPTVVGIIQTLEAKGYLYSVTDQGDKRVKNLYLTEQGEECLSNTQVQRACVEEKVLNGFSEDDTKTLRDLLVRVLDNL